MCNRYLLKEFKNRLKNHDGLLIKAVPSDFSKHDDSIWNLFINETAIAACNRHNPEESNDDILDYCPIVISAKPVDQLLA